MSVFPETPAELLRKFARDTAGGDEADWVRFFGLYAPAIRRFVELNDVVHDPDDVVQEVSLRLVSVLRRGAYAPNKSRFRTFLARLVRRQLISLYRRDRARAVGRIDALEDCSEEPAVPSEQIERIDRAWARAVHEAAVARVLAKKVISEQSRAVYRAHVLEGRSAEEVAAQFGITRNNVGQIKYRVDRAISALESEFEM